MECLECSAELIQIIGKRTKKFCDSSCRSNYWQKQKVLEKKLEKELNSTENKEVQKQLNKDMVLSNVSISKITKTEAKVTIKRVNPNSKEGVAIQEVITHPKFKSDMERELWEMEQKYLKPKK